MLFSHFKAHAGILKSSSTNLQSLSETPEQSPGMAEEPEDETVPTGDLLNLSPVRNKQKQRRATVSGLSDQKSSIGQ